MSKVYQVTEENLVELERIIPELYQSIAIHCQPYQRTRFRQIKNMLSDIRWGGGPYSEIYQIPADAENIDDYLPPDDESGTEEKSEEQE